MTIIVPLPSTAPISHVAKAGVDHLSKLQREAYFYESAWGEVAPYVQSMGEDLVVSCGFERVIKSISMTEFTPLLMHLQRRADSQTTTIILEIPTSIHSFLPRQTFPPGHNETIIRPHQPIHIGIEAMTIGPLVEIVHLLQCFLPGVIPLPLGPINNEDAGSPGHEEVEKRCLPDVKWLLEKELLLREAFGCTYFRYLLDAAREQ